EIGRWSLTTLRENGEGGQDRREGDLARPLPRLPDGGGGGAARAVRPHPGPDREAETARPGPMLTLAGCNGRQPGSSCARRAFSGYHSQAGRHPETSRTLVAGVKAVLSPPSGQNTCLQGREGGIAGPRRGWA